MPFVYPILFATISYMLAERLHDMNEYAPTTTRGSLLNIVGTCEVYTHSSTLAIVKMMMPFIYTFMD